MRPKIQVMKESICSCQRCVQACKNSPCFPSPSEAMQLGMTYGNKMAYTKYIDQETGRHTILLAPLLEKDGCVFLRNNLCQLHDLGLKPVEGRITNHDQTYEQAMATRRHVCDMWQDYQALLNPKK